MISNRNFAPCFITERLRALGIADADIRVLKSSYSVDAINRCINVMQNDGTTTNKTRSIFEFLQSGKVVSPMRLHPKVFRTVDTVEDFLPQSPRKEREVFMKELLGLHSDKFNRLKHLIRNNLHDLRIFYLPEVLKQKILRDLDSEDCRTSPRFALAVRMLLRGMRKTLEDNF